MATPQPAVPRKPVYGRAQQKCRSQVAHAPAGTQWARKPERRIRKPPATPEFLFIAAAACVPDQQPAFMIRMALCAGKASQKHGRKHHKWHGPETVGRTFSRKRRIGLRGSWTQSGGRSGRRAPILILQAQTWLSADTHIAPVPNAPVLRAAPHGSGRIPEQASDRTSENRTR